MRERPRRCRPPVYLYCPHQPLNPSSSRCISHAPATPHPARLRAGTPLLLIQCGAPPQPAALAPSPARLHAGPPPLLILSPVAASRASAPGHRERASAPRLPAHKEAGPPHFPRHARGAPCAKNPSTIGAPMTSISFPVNQDNMMFTMMHMLQIDYIDPMIKEGQVYYMELYEV
ncbi:hypothetical protein VPH35_106259 [Triticum aestivum]|uniref:putative transcription factor SPT20 homolog-like 2 n=1 Tax=Triticum aestivum TaxID=4565 RepID=UPI001D013EF8|nr:putative transcription factor SPT20 homolog-like 2 [Triticum aestivum]